jgi:hypothetical protein
LSFKASHVYSTLRNPRGGVPAWRLRHNWAVLDLLITHQTNGIHFNTLDQQRLKRMRYEGHQQPTTQEVTAA